MEENNKEIKQQCAIHNVTCCIATEHAYVKAKERMKWKPKVLDKMKQKAFNEGIQHKDTKGTLKKYITKIWFRYKFCNNIRIYGENIYFFCYQKLITLYRLNSKLLKHLQYCR